KGYLILSRAGVAVIEEMCAGDKIEIFPFTLVDARGRVKSTDHAIVNPLTKIKCLDVKASGAVFDKSGDFISLTRHVLTKKGVADAPHLFRVAETRQSYVFSRALGKKFNEAGVTNVRGSQLA